MSYIQFCEVARPPRYKTRYWDVLTKAPPIVSIGFVQWFGPWRCYSFHPAAETVFEKKCLREIAAFCDDQTRLHREGR